jgi:prepilin-type N-terminal cleavage/methylation domain-containing protein
MTTRRRGFTAAELLVVMSVVAVLMTIAASRLLTLRDEAAVHAASGEALHAFAFAREAAVSRRAAIAVRLDTANGVIVVQLPARVLHRRALRSIYGVSLATNRDSMAYDPRGLGFGAANLSLVIRRGSAVDTITVARLGRVR